MLCIHFAVYQHILILTIVNVTIEVFFVSGDAASIFGAKVSLDPEDGGSIAHNHVV
jgi:hypothetical protein